MQKKTLLILLLTVLWLVSAVSSPSGSNLVPAGLSAAEWAHIQSQLPPVQQQKLAADDAAENAQFGTTVAIDGNTAVVGAYFIDSRRGAVYVFEFDGETWTQQAKLRPADNASGDEFGTAVNIEGDWIVATSPLDNIDGISDVGSAYVFRREGGAWVEEGKLAASDMAANDTLGDSIAINNNTIIVGARQHEDTGGENSGAAYIFVREQNGEDVTWVEQAKLIAFDRSDLDRFGFAVDVDGDTAVVGSSLDDDLAENSGAAYIFVRSGTSWSHQAKLTGNQALAYYSFGYSVSISGETVAIGATGSNDGATSNSGAVYVFTRTGIAWNQQDILRASDRTNFDTLGSSVDIRGDTLLAGAGNADVDGLEQAGAAYLFARSGEDWSEIGKLTADDGAAQDWFGWSVSFSGDRAIVGAPRDDDAGLESGSAYLFSISSAILTVAKAGTGTGHVGSVPMAIECGAICTADFLPGTVVTLTATPLNGATFAGWSGAVTSTANPITVTMDVAQTVIATFNDNTVIHPLTISKAGAGTGQVASTPAGILCGGACSANFAEGGIVMLTATADGGSIFTGWSGDMTSTANPLQVGMDGSKNITANFILTASLSEVVYLPLVMR